MEFEVNAAVTAQGPPIPAGVSVGAADQVASYPAIRIDPTEATNYESLPEDYKSLYGPAPMEISLEDIVQQTLSHNRDISIQGYTLNIAEDQVPLSKGIYDLILTGSAQWIKTKEQSPSALSSSGRRNRAYSLALSQLIPTGGTIELEFLHTRVNQNFAFATLNPTITQRLNARISQPLLRGFGPKITNLDIHVSQMEHQASAADFETEVQSQLRSALDSYWDLVLAARTYDVQLISFLAAEELLRINSAKVEAGVMAPTEELQAQASVEERREQVIRARQLVRDTEDLLKQLMFFRPGAPAWLLELRPVQELTWREVEINPKELLGEALALRPEIRAQERRLSARGLEVYRAKNDRLAQLDLNGQAGIMGLSDDGTKAIENLGTADFNNFSLSLDLRYPFQNRQARFAHKQAITAEEREVERLRQVEDQVVFDIRNATRELQTSRERIEITRKRVESEQANLDAEMKKLEVGVSTSFEVLDFQESVAAAGRSYIQSIVDYNKGINSLERARGTILQTYGVRIASPVLDPEYDRVLFPIGFN